MRLILLLLFAPSLCFAQAKLKVGINIGSNYAFSSNDSFTGSPGFNSSLMINTTPSGGGCFQVEMGFMQTNLERSDIKIKSNYLRGAALIKVFPFKSHLNVLLGPQLSYLMSYSVSGNDMDIDGDKGRGQMVFGVGAETEKVDFSLRYNHNFNEDYREIRLFQMSLGIFFEYGNR